MNLTTLMNSNGIALEWLFTLARLDTREGLMFFEPVTETLEDETEVTNLEPRCFMIDEGKFVYDEEMDNTIVVNSVDRVITFTRVDGIQLNVDTNVITGFPFAHEQFRDTVFEARSKDVPKDHVEIDADFI